MTLRIGVIGDLHTHWDELDVLHFNQSPYDLLLFTGDLGGGTAESSLRMAQTMSRLEKETLVMPGNNDVGDITRLAVELSHRSGIKRLAAIRTGESAPSATVRLCGYSAHRFVRGDVDVTLIAGRPHSMGGPELSFPEHMASSYRVETMRHSAERLRALVDECQTEAVLFFSHNGPQGLGGEPDDMWGCDFKPDGGDWGDPDLAQVIDYALDRGKRVLAVVAGHMHLRTKCDRERPWLKHQNDVAYVNAARVPRIAHADGEVQRHHLAVTLTADGVEIAEVLVGGAG